MTARGDVYRVALDRAHAHALAWLDSVPDRPIGPRQTADEVLARLATPLPDGPSDPAAVVDLLAEIGDPGLMAMGSGRFYGWVIGGTLPAAMAADWLVSAWDQTPGLRYIAPTAAAAEDAAAGWLLDLLGLPTGSDVGFTTGATMASFTGLMAGRFQVLADAGWDVNSRGLSGAPAVTTLVGAERHDTIDCALRYLGLGAPVPVAADDQGRIRLDALAAALEQTGGPTILCLQAGNIHSGAFDPIGEAVALAHAHGVWVHVDGAFGLWAAAVPSLRHHLAGCETADSWSTDAHKTLNVPYDSGLIIVADPRPLRAACDVHAAYLQPADEHGWADPLAKVPEMSRRARGVPIWAALRSLGRSGVADLVEGQARNARAIAVALGQVDGAEVLNEVVFTQVLVSFGDDKTTRAVIDAVIADGTTWMSGSRWHDRDVLRVSVSNWSTDADDVTASVDAVLRAVKSARSSA